MNYQQIAKQAKVVRTTLRPHRPIPKMQHFWRFVVQLQGRALRFSKRIRKTLRRAGMAGLIKRYLID